MKKSKIIGVLGLLASVALAWAAVTMAPQAVILSWSPTPDFDSNGVVRIYHSTDFTVPRTNWVVLTNVPGTQSNVTFNVVPGPHFFVATYSNFWGETDFSNVASTPPFPRSDVNLVALRGTNSNGGTNITAGSNGP